MNLTVFLILAVFASDKKENGTENDPENEERYGNNFILVKIEEDEYAKVNKKSKYIGVTYNKNESKWRAYRRSKDENKLFYNGSYDDEETAALASDNLARKLMENGKQKLKLNFPDDDTEIYREEKSSKYIGVNKNNSKWRVKRWSKDENKIVYNGSYDDEETAALASDNLARKLMENGDLKLKLNFPEKFTEVYPEKASKFIGVSYNKNELKWRVRRRSKIENTHVYNGCFNDEETAAHASDTLARKLMENGIRKLKLNFPDDHTEIYREEKTSKFIGVSYNKNNSKWKVQRRSRNANMMVYNGCYVDEETAAHASDILARKLMKNGEQNHKLNFSDDNTEVYPENQNKKRKRPKD